MSRLYYEETESIKFGTLEKLCKALDCEITIIRDNRG
ncbi:helix-turn-helix domain-containing protein [Bacillus subtilis]